MARNRPALIVCALAALVLLAACGSSPPPATATPATKPFRDATIAEWLAAPDAARLSFLSSALGDYTACTLTPREVDAGMHTLYTRPMPATEPPVRVFALIVTGAGCRRI